MHARGKEIGVADTRKFSGEVPEEASPDEDPGLLTHGPRLFGWVPERIHEVTQTLREAFEEPRRNLRIVVPVIVTGTVLAAGIIALAVVLLATRGSSDGGSTVVPIPPTTTVTLVPEPPTTTTVVVPAPLAPESTSVVPATPVEPTLATTVPSATITTSTSVVPALPPATSTALEPSAPVEPTSAPTSAPEAPVSATPTP